MLAAPVATWDVEKLADWIELKAITSADGNSSITDLVREFQRNGTSEEVFDTTGRDGEGAALDEPDEVDVDTRSMMRAEDAFAAVEDRARACDGAYPFEIAADSIQLRADGLKTAYLFLLLLGEYGQRPGITRATKTFEHMCAWATRNYLGPAAAAVVFGFPRDVPNLSAGFVSAVDDLGNLLNEGAQCRRSPKAAHQKDAGLDIVAWRGFPDGREGKLVAFGQCATGDDWIGKTTELLPETWCNMWFDQSPVATPLLRLFFLPYCVRRIEWELVSRKAGIVFDRCRLAHCIALSGDDPELREKWCNWSEMVHAKLRASVARMIGRRTS